jgi:hypothetical protein
MLFSRDNLLKERSMRNRALAYLAIILAQTAALIFLGMTTWRLHDKNGVLESQLISLNQGAYVMRRWPPRQGGPQLMFTPSEFQDPNLPEEFKRMIEQLQQQYKAGTNPFWHPSSPGPALPSADKR